MENRIMYTLKVEHEFTFGANLCVRSVESFVYSNFCYMQSLYYSKKS